MPYRDFVQVEQPLDGERCTASAVLHVSDEGQVEVTCNLASDHDGNHTAHIVPLGKDGATPFGVATGVEWGQ